MSICHLIKAPESAGTWANCKICEGFWRRSPRSIWDRWLSTARPSWCCTTFSGWLNAAGPSWCCTTFSVLSQWTTFWNIGWALTGGNQEFIRRVLIELHRNLYANGGNENVGRREKAVGQVKTVQKLSILACDSGNGPQLFESHCRPIKIVLQHCIA